MTEVRPTRRFPSMSLPMSYSARLGMTGVLFIAPALVFFLVFNLFPVLYAFVISLTDFDLFNPMRFVGIKNYLDLTGNANFARALQVTILFTVLTGAASSVIGFALASVLREALPGRGIFRTIFYAPTVLSLVGVSTAWSVLFRIEGPINGLFGAHLAWLTNEQTALMSVVIMTIWHSTGWYMIVFLAGLQSIPEIYYEASRLDGAGWRHLLSSVTLPLLRPVIAYVAIVAVVNGMKVFTPMFVLTSGGPNDATRSLAMLVYQVGLRDFRMGSAAAMSTLGFAFLALLMVVQLKVFRVHEETGL